MSAHDVVPVAWFYADHAETLKTEGRTTTVLYGVSIGRDLPLYSQATVDALQKRIDKLEREIAELHAKVWI